VEKAIAEREAAMNDLAEGTTELDRGTYSLDREMKIYNEESDEHDELKTELDLAISAMTKAIDAIGGWQTGFLQTGFLQMREDKSIQEILMIADAMGFTEGKTVSALLQSTAPGDYEFHSAGIVKLLEGLKEKFSTKASELMAEWQTRKSAHDGEAARLTSANQAADLKISTSTTKQATEESTISTERTTLVTKKDELEKANDFLSDLTDECSDRKVAHDASMATFTGEIAALAKAKELLTGDRVKTGAYNANRLGAAPAFLQMSREAAMRRKALALISQLPSEGGLAVKQSLKRGDPLAKIKTLIKELIERLLKEAGNEAEKEGHCNTEVTKSTTEFLHAQDAMNAAAAKVTELNSQVTVHINDIAKLKKDKEDEAAAVEAATRERAQDSEANIKTISELKSTLAAVADAINVLEDFYKGAQAESDLGRNAARMQDDEANKDRVNSQLAAGMASGGVASDRGVSRYGGAQGQGGIGQVLDLLRQTEEELETGIQGMTDSEAKAHKAHVKRNRKGLAFVQGTGTSEDNTRQDLNDLQKERESTFADLEAARDLMDAHSKKLTELDKMCGDTSQSWDEMKGKIEEEIAALKECGKALGGEGGIFA